MFDDPQKELAKLQQELLASDEEDERWESEDDLSPEELQALLADDPDTDKKKSKGGKRRKRKGKKSHEREREREPRREDTGRGSLVFAILLELGLVALLVMWWWK